MKRPELKLVISLGGPATIEGPVDQLGYGDDDESAGQELCVSGKIANLKISRGEDEFSLHIRPDGTLIVTHYKGGFEMNVPQNVRLIPHQPWKQDID